MAIRKKNKNLKKILRNQYFSAPNLAKVCPKNKNAA
jgi:hypothetical protein